MVSDGQNQNVTPKREEEPVVEDIFDFKEKERPAEAEKPPEVKKEILPEVRPEKERAPLEEEMARKKVVVAPPVPKKEEAVPKSQTQMEIENILSENLQDIYSSMTPSQRMQFRQKGEETASKINEILKAVSVKVKQVLNLIKDWLKLIPGVNKFFLEQEAKIKTDRILALRERKIKEKQK